MLFVNLLEYQNEHELNLSTPQVFRLVPKQQLAHQLEEAKEISPHQLRHSYATHLMNNGTPLEVIQSLLGHVKSETTRIYAELSRKQRLEHYSKYF